MKRIQMNHFLQDSLQLQTVNSTIFPKKTGNGRVPLLRPSGTIRSLKNAFIHSLSGNLDQSGGKTVYWLRSNSLELFPDNHAKLCFTQLYRTYVESDSKQIQATSSNRCLELFSKLFSKQLFRCSFKSLFPSVTLN